MADASELAVRAIETRISSNITDMDAGWTAADNVSWAGVDFVPGSNDWMRPRVEFAETQWGTHGVQGTGKNEIVGILTTSFFIRPGTGLGTMRGYIAGFRDLFDRASIAVTGHGNVEFGPAGAPRPGPEEDGWEHQIVDCPFTIEEHGA